jgi:hypothetical protein
VPTPTISSTRIARCTIFRRNEVYANNNLTTPDNAYTEQLVWGVGIEPLGTYGDLFTANHVYGNANFGILALENPDPFPPTNGTVYFQLSGNAFVGNRIEGGRYAGLALVGGLFGTKESLDNCVDGNTGTTLPTDMSAWSCSLATTPNPDLATSQKLVGVAVALQSQSLARKPKGQPAPPAQPTMPKPCAGVPRNPLCADR